MPRPSKKPPAQRSAKPAPEPPPNPAPAPSLRLVDFGNPSGAARPKPTPAAPSTARKLIPRHEPAFDPEPAQDDPGRGGGPETPAAPPRGLVCRKCGCAHLLKTYYTRPQADGSVMRRRQCRHCGTMMSTRERPV